MCVENSYDYKFAIFDTTNILKSHIIDIGKRDEWLDMRDEWSVLND